MAVDLDGRVGYVMPDDLDDVGRAAVDRAAAAPRSHHHGLEGARLVPGPAQAGVFDTNGNAGATIWCDGRIVGGWRQDGCGEVEVQLLEDVGREARRAIDAEAARLTGWLAGARVQPRFPSPSVPA